MKLFALFFNRLQYGCHKGLTVGPETFSLPYNCFSAVYNPYLTEINRGFIKNTLLPTVFDNSATF